MAKFDNLDQPTIYGKYLKVPGAYRVLLAPSHFVGIVSGGVIGVVDALSNLVIDTGERYRPPHPEVMLIGGTVSVLAIAAAAQITGYAAKAAAMLKLTAIAAFAVSNPLTAIIGLSIMLDMLTGFRAFRVGYRQIFGYSDAERPANWTQEIHARSKANRARKYQHRP